MGRLDDISLQDLQNQLEQTDGEKSTKRVLTAIARKQGDTLERLAERHNVCEKTIRNWLDRFAGVVSVTFAHRGGTFRSSDLRIQDVSKGLGRCQ